MTTTHVAASVPLPPPVARPQDAPLRQDVRWLAATLGRVVRRLAGEDTFRAVEDLRRGSRARRLGVPGAPDLDALLARTRSLPPETARLTARAFTVFFILINAAEQAHRVRRSRQDDLAAPRGRGGAPLAHRGGPARPAVRHGRGVECPLVLGGPPARGRVPCARATGPGVRGRVRLRTRPGDPPHSGELGRG